MLPPMYNNNMEFVQAPGMVAIMNEMYHDVRLIPVSDGSSGAHLSPAVRQWRGDSRGHWDGDTLVVTTTHLKESYLRRTGLMQSDQATVRTRWRRVGNYLQATVIIYDPVMMTEPYTRSTMMWVNDPAMNMSPYPCEEATETAIPRGTVPHFLPGASPLPGLDKNVTDRFGTPYEPRLGGAQTMFPEYIAKIRTMPKPAKVVSGGEGGN